MQKPRLFRRFDLRTFYYVLLVLFVSSCLNQTNQHAGKSIFRYNEAAGIVSLDPAFSRDQAHLWICNQLYNGLVQLDDNLNIKPSIAIRWELSGDGLTYIFHLRQDVYFHQSEVFEKGTRAVVANDFVYSFNRLLDPATASPGSWVFSNIEKKDEQYTFIANNDSTLTIRLQKPFPAFLGILTMQYCSVIPHEAVEKHKTDFRIHPVGTGPFYLQNWEENVKMVMRKNENYFEWNEGQRMPFLDAVSVSFLADKMTAFLEFTKGNLDFISGIDPSYKDELLNRNGALREKYTGRFNMMSLPYLNTEYLGILVDTNLPDVRNNLLKIKAVRQAINYGFDREKMIRYLRNGIGIPGIKGIIPKGMPTYDENANYGYSFNPEKSKSLLINAGFGSENPVPSITLVTTSDYLDLCKFVQSQLQDVGFTIEIEVSPPAAVIERRAQSRINFFRASWIADYPDEENYLSLFYSENFAPSGPNYTHFSDANYDELYRQAFGISNREERTKLYREMDSMVMEQAPVVVLYYDQALRFVQKNIEGMTSNSINLLNLKNVRKN